MYIDDYFKIKGTKAKDYILFWQLGDFYEILGTDAKTASAILELTLTGRPIKGTDERILMCGLPYFRANEYIIKLLENGQKVAIYDDYKKEISYQTKAD